MTQTVENPAHWDQRRQEWVARVQNLIDDIVSWSQAEGWRVEHDRKPVREKLLREYEVPTLVVHLPGGDLAVNPIALHVTGAEGRVDLEAFPTLSRVKLLGTAAGWQIVTDSNVPLRVPWNRDTFIQLAQDLLA